MKSAEPLVLQKAQYWRSKATTRKTRKSESRGKIVNTIYPESMSQLMRLWVGSNFQHESLKRIMWVEMLHSSESDHGNLDESETDRPLYCEELWFSVNPSRGIMTQFGKVIIEVGSDRHYVTDEVWLRMAALKVELWLTITLRRVAHWLTFPSWSNLCLLLLF